MKNKIASDLNIPLGMIDQALMLAHTHVKKFYISKKNGQKRLILQPSKRLKVLQYWLIHNVFVQLPVHSCAMAYREGLSILDNAKRHKKNRFFVKLDLKDFFPSIEFDDLLPIIANWHTEAKPGWNLDSDAIDLIKNSCFYKGNRLPIGYPSSPSISNAVMYEVDKRISLLIADVEKYGNLVYTRYADDLVFSTNQKGVSQNLIRSVTNIIENNTNPKFEVNRAKTKIGSSSGGTASVTGLKVCPNEHITINRNSKDHVRLLLGLYSKGSLNSQEFDHLLGHLSFIQHVAPDFYSKLSFKYFNEIENLKKHIVVAVPTDQLKATA